MKYVKINNSTYGFAVNFKNNKDIRTSFNNLTEVTYGFNFEEWYQNGFWGDRYIPYSLLDGDKVISNVSVNVIEFIIEGEKKIGIQIGTVMTDKGYRNQGLNKFIMEQVLDEWKDRSDFIYLFANDSVLDFYPKFNFVTVDQYQHSKLITANNTNLVAKKLNIEDVRDREFLLETINMSIPVSKVSMYDNASLIMFYCTSFMKNSIYYIDELKAIVIAEFDDDILYLTDIFTIEDVNLKDIVQVMTGKDIKRVILGFTPLDETDFSRNLLKEEDTTLFVLRDKVDYFRDNQTMFPVLSRA